jgi:hypothetical protein
MLRAMHAISATRVIHDVQEAQRCLRAALASYAVDEDLIRPLCALLEDDRAVLRVGPYDLILWVRTDEDSEAWFSVEPTGFRRLM